MLTRQDNNNNNNVDSLYGIAVQELKIAVLLCSHSSIENNWNEQSQEQQYWVKSFT